MPEAEVGGEGAEMAPDHTYERYKSLGGIINEQDYQSAMDRAGNATTVDKTLVAQAELMARVAGITLNNAGEALDPRTVLYGTLRRDRNLQQAQHHHSQMSDQRLFAEALRMRGDEDALKKLIEAHPHISF